MPADLELSQEEFAAACKEVGAEISHGFAGIIGGLSKDATFSVEARKSGGRWITIGSKTGGDGKKHGGSPVFVDRSGRITKGHPGLTGKKIDALKEDPEERPSDKNKAAGVHRAELNQSKNYNRSVWAKKARAEGLDAKGLHQLAGEMLVHDKEYKADVSRMLKDARATAEHYGSKLGGKAFKDKLAKGTFDYSTLPHFDEIAASMAVEHPDVFHGHNGREEERLADLLASGEPEPMSEDDAYSEAFDTIKAHADKPEDLPDWVTDHETPPDESTANFFGQKEQTQSLWQEGMNQETDKWVQDMPQKASEPLYTPNKPTPNVGKVKPPKIDVEYLKANTGPKAPSKDPLGLEDHGVPGGLENKVLASIRELKAKGNPFQSPTIPAILAAIGGDRRDVQAVLVKLHRSGKVTLGPYTEPLATIPDAEAVIPLDRDPKWFVRLANA